MNSIILFVTILIICTVRSSVQNDAKIVGGSDSKQTPYQISLQVKTRRSAGFFNNIFSQNNESEMRWQHNCGGSIISKKHVLTAAHCVNDFKPERLSVVSGTCSSKKGGDRHLISKITVHEEYIELKQHDIAILELVDEFTVNENTQLIEYDTEFIEAGEICTLTGWGYTYPIRVGDTPELLQRVELPAISNEECQRTMNDVSEREICTFKGVLAGACGGDSGGPLVCKNKVHGVVSYGFRFCGAGVPDVYTRVSQYTEWIAEHTK